MRTKNGKRLLVDFGGWKIGLIFLLLLIIVPVAAWSQTSQLPKTGQTICYDNEGEVISCAGTGQDGEIQAGAAWPNPRFTTNVNDTVTDNMTGLVWSKDANPAGAAKTWQEALDYIKTLNSSNYLGYNDWRLPNINELKSLVDLQRLNPSLSADHPFSNVQSSYYWSSSTYAYYTYRAWLVFMQDGIVYRSNKANDSYVWPVRGGQSGSLGSLAIYKTGQSTCYDTAGTVIACAGTGQDGEIQAGAAWPDPRFTNNGNQTVTDNITGLVWSKDATPAGALKTWQGALDYIKTLNSGKYLGYNDWRLPNRNELTSLVDISLSNPALPSGHPFAYVQSYYYWSSSTSANGTNGAWIVDMVYGDVLHSNKAYSNYHVWPVRGGQSGSLGSLYGSFTNYGLYKYDGSAWSPINSVNPDKMKASGGTLYADFANYGLYKYAAGAWTEINKVHPTSMLSSDGKLYATFTGYGLYLYDGTNWIPINSVNPDKMTVSGGVLYADFANYGLYKYTGGAWTEINKVHPTNMLSSDGKLYATFTGYGFYKYESNAWGLINSVNPDKMTASGGVLYADFANYGLYKYAGGVWSPVNTVRPTNILSSDGKLYATFADFGFYKYDGTGWALINSVNPDSMTVSGGILYATFTAYGYYKYDGTTWTQINTVIPKDVVAGE